MLALRDLPGDGFDVETLVGSLTGVAAQGAA